MSKTKGSAVKRYTEKELAGTVDRLGEVRAEKKRLEAEEKELKKILEPSLNENVIIYGQKYVASKVTPIDRIPNNKKVIKALSLDWFIENAKVGIGVLSNALGKEDVDSVTTAVAGAPRVNVDPI